MIGAVLKCCAGIDVGKKFVVVCVMTGPADGEAHEQTRKYGTNNGDLEKLRDWLKKLRMLPCGDGEYRRLLEADFQRSGRSGGNAGRAGKFPAG